VLGAIAGVARTAIKTVGGSGNSAIAVDRQIDFAGGEKQCCQNDTSEFQNPICLVVFLWVILMLQYWLLRKSWPVPDY
jgi:hypothetical protein